MLSRVAIRGFKSFARATDVDLGEGVNVVVGPNGSGKSNLVEAILWALGEQRPANLRADGMQQILFGGDSSLPQASFAEVSLTLTRDDPPSGMPAEMQVTRRLTRAGDAHYRVDGVDCRLLDLRERLADWGLSADGLSVIRQGQVERLCTSKPADIRAIVEESAGVAVSRRRRRRAELKLGRVQTQLDRARDVADEVTSRRRSLGRQARAAERAAELERDVAAARDALAAAAAWHAHIELTAARGAQAERAGDRAEAARLLEAARTEHDAAGERREEARQRLEEVDRAAADLSSAAERVRGRGELASDRVRAELERAERDARDRERALSQRDELRGELGVREAAEADARQELERAEETASAAESRLREVRERERTCRDASATASRAVSEAEQEAQDSSRAAASASEAIARARGRVDELGPADDDRDIERAERRDAIASRRATLWAERFDDAERAAGDARADREAAEARSREYRAEAARLDPKAGESATGGVGAGLTVAEGLERAVAAALGALVDAVPVKGVAEGRKVIEGGAPAAVVPATGHAPGTAPAGASPLAEAVVDCDAGARPHVERLLADAWLVEDLKAVPKDAEGVFVTKDGLALRPRLGILTGVGGTWARRATFERAAERAEAADEDAREAAERSAATGEVVAWTEARRRAAEASAARAAERLAALRAARAGRAAAVQEAGDALQAAERALAEAERRSAAAAETLSASTQSAAEAAEAHRVERDALAGEEAAWRDAAAAAADARATLAAESAARAEVAGRLETATAAAAAAPPEPPELGPVRDAVEALGGLSEALGAAAERVRGEAGEHRRALGVAEEAHVAARREADRAEARAASAGEAANRADIEAAVAEERAKEAGDAPEDDPGVEPDAARQRLDALERSLAAVGPVNALAAEELAEIDGRREELQEQIDDLSQAAASLAEHLEELDQVVRTGFEEALRVVEERFAEVIGLLFPGGRGRLRSVGEDDDDPGLVIEVVPAGKAARSLSLLSGGERSLVALSFLLSLAMTRPAPVYLLDEVEAALDDVNLRRFLGVVRRLTGSAAIQFVLITHQQATVEAADTLFGVTVEAGGASKLVSRRLDREAEMARPRLTAIAGGGG